MIADTTKKAARHGGALLVECLEKQGVDRIFCIPGESYLAALDGLYDADIDVVVARHEGGAAIMAEADGKMTGRPGICFVTRGPGATNASAGVHIAFQDSTPMILFVGQVAMDQRDREAFQEVDYRRMFAPLAKWVAEIETADRIPEYVARAFRTAMSGRPGPVVLALPEDVLSGPAEGRALPKVQPARQGIAESDLAALAVRLGEAERPIIIAGGGGWSSEAAQSLGRFAQVAQIPVAVSFRCQDYIDNRHPNYAGDVGIGLNPDLAARVRESDAILALGPRLGEMTTGGYTLLPPATEGLALLHVHPDPAELGRVFTPEMAFAARPGDVICQLADIARAPDVDRSDYVNAARAAYESWQLPVPSCGDVRMEEVIQHLVMALPDASILTNGAGNYASWLHRYFRYPGWKSQLAPTSGSMGYGLPAAIAAKLRNPGHDVVCLAGDGCFQMVAQEFGTACQYGANIVVIVVNNGIYGTIRMHQQKTYPDRVSGTTLQNPDFPAFAMAYSGFGALVERTDEFPQALADARASGKPALIELRISSEAITPTQRLSSL